MGKARDFCAFSNIIKMEKTKDQKNKSEEENGTFHLVLNTEHVFNMITDTKDGYAKYM